MGIKGGGSPETVTTRVHIPKFLGPVAGLGSAITSDVLTDLAGPTFISPSSRTMKRTMPVGRGGIPGSAGGGGAIEGGQGLLLGNTLAPFAPQQEQAFDLATSRALGADGFLPTFQSELLSTAGGRDLINVPGVDQLMRTASGSAIDAPGFQNAFETSLRRATPRIKGAFTLAGRSGGGLESVAQSQAAADAFASLFGQERNRQVGAAGALADFGNAERERQLRALGALPSAALADVGILQDVGAQLQAQRQREIEAPIAARERLLSLAGGPLGLNAFLGQSQTSPLHSNTGAGVLGGAATGAGIGSALALSNPWTAALAIGGGLLGSGALG